MDSNWDLATCFSLDYATARARFSLVCAKQGAPIRSYVNPSLGPSGEELATDVVWFGAKNARKVLVLTSATHGVEGFCGSGAQIDWIISGGPASLPDDAAVLIIHALNPYGFAWLRRVTEENVDLNRNGLDFSQPLPDNPGYAALKDAFCPVSLKGQTFEAALAAIDRFRREHGDAEFRRARSSGQHIDPKGIHYGGTGPTWPRLTLEEIIRNFELKNCEQVAVIDYHTGLGRYGYGEPICGSRPGEPGQARARAWYGPSLTEPLLGTSTSSVIPGLTQYIWLREIGAPRITFIALEYGTYPADDVNAAMVEENWLYARGNPDWDLEEAKVVRDRLRQVFHPDRADWKEMVLARSRQVISQTLNGLSSIS
jgi:hypothetical protein